MSKNSNQKKLEIKGSISELDVICLHGSGVIVVNFHKANIDTLTKGEEEELSRLKKFKIILSEE